MLGWSISDADHETHHRRTRAADVERLDGASGFDLAVPGCPSDLPYRIKGHPRARGTDGVTYTKEPTRSVERQAAAPLNPTFFHSDPSLAGRRQAEVVER